MEEEKGLKTNDKPWLFKKGNPGGPGRPKGSGKSLKEYSREFLSKMTDEERMEFLEGLPKVDIWKMAEGLPSQHTDVTSGGKPLYLPPELLKKNELDDSSSSPEHNSE